MSGTNPFANLLASRPGAPYSQSSVVSWSHYNDPIAGTVAGNSHIWGDASETTQMASVNALIQAAANAGLSTSDTATLLSIVYVESGFNPSAAAGTTSASGLGQFIKDTGASYGLTSANRWDVNAQAQAAVGYFIAAANKADSRGQGDASIYAYWHDGLGSSGNAGAGFTISNNRVMPLVSQFETALNQAAVWGQSAQPIPYLDPTAAADQVLGAESWLQPSNAPNVLSPDVASAFTAPGANWSASVPYLDQTAVAQQQLDSEFPPALSQAAFNNDLHQGFLDVTDVNYLQSTVDQAASGSMASATLASTTSPWSADFNAIGQNDGSNNIAALTYGLSSTPASAQTPGLYTDVYGNAYTTQQAANQGQDLIQDQGDDGGGDGPVLLDLAGKGINVTQLTSSNTYEDTTGDGYKNLTAWAGVGNGVLFVDLTGQGQLTQANQIIFTDWDPGASSDMQALLDVFDTNHDGALDAGDADFSKFFVMVTNASGTQSAVSLAALGITSINLNANAVNVALPDGSSIDGETTFTMTDPSSGVTTTNTAATVTLATDANGYVVATTTTANADGSETVANVASNADGSVAYERILNTSANGLARTLTELNSGGVVTTIQSDDTVVNADGSTTETLTNYAGGTIAANGELTAAGTTGSDKLNATTTTTSADGKVVTILRDQIGGGWTTQQEVDTTNADGSRSIVVSDLNFDGSASNVTTTAVSADGLTRTVTSLVDGIAADSTVSLDVTVVSGATRTETVTDTVGTTVTSLVITVTQTATNSVTRTTTSDLADGSTLDLTSVAQTVTNADGSAAIEVKAQSGRRRGRGSPCHPSRKRTEPRASRTNERCSFRPSLHRVELRDGEVDAGCLGHIARRDGRQTAASANAWIMMPPFSNRRHSQYFFVRLRMEGVADGTAVCEK